MSDARDFYAQKQEEQVRRLGALARAALSRWSLDDAVVRPIAYRENMTFAVEDASRGRFALRVHQAGYRTEAEVQSELDFMEYLNGEGILTPRVVHAADGASFVSAGYDAVPEPRQCDLFEWIDGTPLRKSGEPPTVSPDEAARQYADVGRQAARVYEASARWQRPAGFSRPVWDPEGILGETAHLGDFRKIERATDAQRSLLVALAERLTRDLEAFGREPDRWGLSQGDLLAENLMVCGDGLRLIDFDDAGESWCMFDMATAFFDLLGSEYLEPCLEGFVTGFREHRSLPDEHLAMLPTFLLARVLSYLGHTVSRRHLAQSELLQPVLVAMLEEQGRAYLNG